MSTKLTLLALVAILLCSAESYANRPKDFDMAKCEQNYPKKECIKKKMVREGEQAEYDRHHKS